MTNAEAIEAIKCAIAEVEWEYPIEYAAAFDKAIEALKKQIQMKPKSAKDTMWGETVEVSACPECDMILFQLIGKNGENESYCGCCGQAIDWKEVSDETETSDT